MGVTMPSAPTELELGNWNPTVMDDHTDSLVHFALVAGAP